MSAATSGAQTRFRPLADRVLVRRLEADLRSAGGIIIPDSAQEKPQEGEVLACGPGAMSKKHKLIPMDVAPGDRVLFGKYAGSEIILDGEELVVVNSGELLAVLDGNAGAKSGASAAPKPAAKKPSKKKEEFVSDAPAPASLLTAPQGGKKDDLKKIKGIGPVFEKVLNERGVYHFHQLAAFSASDVEWMAMQIKSFPDRIDRDEWVNQAKVLAG